MQKAIIPKVAKTSVNAGSATTSTSTAANPKSVSEKTTDVSSVKKEMNIPPEARKQMEDNEAAKRAYDTVEGLAKTDSQRDFRLKNVNGGVIIEDRDK